jgi:hypothetical protein
MKLITIHSDNFVSVTVPKREDINVNQLLTVEEILKQYPEVFGTQLGSFPGNVRLEVNENVKPVITPTRRVPTALKEQFKEELDRLETLGVIARVDKPTPWVSSVVVTMKKSGALRVCIDPKPLNAALKRERTTCYQSWPKPKYFQQLIYALGIGIAFWMRIQVS